MVEAKSGVGILCLKCWDDLPAPERINLHYEFWLMHLKWWQLLLVLCRYPGAAAGWKRLRRAIELDSVQEWQGYCQGCGEFTKIVGMAAKVCRVCGKRLQERVR